MAEVVLYSNVKNPLQRRSYTKHLLAAVAAGATGIVLPFETAKKVQEANPAYVTGSLVDPNQPTGEVRLIATSQAISDAQQAAPLPEQKRIDVAAVSSTIEVETDVDLPGVKRGGERAAQWPQFDQLVLPEGKEFGGSFFVPDAADFDASKSMASVVSSRNRIGKTQHPQRIFTIRAKQREFPKGNGPDAANPMGRTGARIWIVAPKSAEGQAASASTGETATNGTAAAATA